jgi:VWFA-related protein
MQITILLGLLLSLCLGCSTGAYGQLQTPQVPVKTTVPDGSIKVETKLPREGLIHIDVAATDSKQNPSPGLAAKDFTLTDRGVPQKVISFAASDPTNELERLTEVVLVLDEVNLSSQQLALAKAESIKFLRMKGGQLAAPTSVYLFTTSGLYATVAPTRDGNALAENVAAHHYQRKVWTISRIPDPFLSTSERVAEEAQRNTLWEAALRAVYTIAIERRDKPGRKLLLWPGFGWLKVDARSQYKDAAFSWLVELSTRIREARMVISEVTVRTQPLTPRMEPRTSRTRTELTIEEFQNVYTHYLAGVRTQSELAEQGFGAYSHFSLPVLAAQSGGLVVDDFSEISRSLEHCVEDARMFYTLSFDPPRAARPDEYHDLNVQLDEPGVSARTNSGYYNQPVFYDQPFSPQLRVSVHELEQILESAAAERDEALANRLEGLELRERLDSPLLSLWKKRLPGKKSIAALVVLADQSVFLDPPAAEITSDLAPSAEAQRQMLVRAVNYLQQVLPKLPDFFAIRTTTEYDQPSPQQAGIWKTALPDQTLREASTEKATLRYRNGHEEQNEIKRNRSSSQKRLNLVGVFSPILGSVLLDAMRGRSTLTWSHWVRGERGTEAVFRYIVRADDTHYYVQYCCLVGGGTFFTAPGYLGELTLDPKTGAILRLTMEAELGWIRGPNLTPILPAEASATMIEYGPVEIGGKEYICPRRSVSILRVRTVSPITVFEQTFEIYGPYETRLNDIFYNDYHKFGAEARLLPDFNTAPDATPNANHQPSTNPPNL